MPQLHLLKQTTDARFEVVVVDNASDDTTPEVVRRHAESDPRIRRVEETVVGLSRAKNAGISNARGELLLFTDDDVVLVDSWVAAYVDFFRTSRPGPVLAGGPVLPIAHDLSAWPAWITASGTVELPRLYHGEVPRRLGEFEWLWGGNMAAPRRLFDAIGGFDESIGVSGVQRGTFEDVELVQRVVAHGGECWYVPAAVIYHRTAAEATRPRVVAGKAFTRGANDVLRHRRGSHYRAVATRADKAASSSNRDSPDAGGVDGVGGCLPHDGPCVRLRACAPLVHGRPAGARSRRPTLSRARGRSPAVGWRCSAVSLGSQPFRGAEAPP